MSPLHVLGLKLFSTGSLIQARSIYLTIQCKEIGHWLGTTLTLFWWVQFCLIEILSLYFLCAYPTIYYWPTHFVPNLAILLFVLCTHSKKKKKTLKYLILIINCGAYWKLTFIWTIYQYCELCHYLTAISSHALLPDPNFKLRIGYLNFCESQLHS